MTFDETTAYRAINEVLSVSRETFDHLRTYHDLLKQWQMRINLVSPSTLDDAWNRHFVDSAQTLAAMPEAETWVDLGSGAGFPGLVTAILLNGRGHWDGHVTLIESNGKKCAFLNTVARQCGLRDKTSKVTVINERIETALKKELATQAVSARALASLGNLFDLSEPLFKAGAQAVFSKGRGYVDEIERAEKDWIFDRKIQSSRVEEDSVLITVSGLQKRQK